MNKAKGREFTPSELSIRCGQGGTKTSAGSIVRNYYCSAEGTRQTTLPRGGKLVSRWVCAEHMHHQSTRETRSARARHFVLPGWGKQLR